jgi:ring-1,2-phenylacetyl-CoA epoxidase subunit PaaB
VPAATPAAGAYEVFAQVQAGKPLAHVGSVRAPDPILAWQSARAAFGRRDNLSTLWVVPRSAIVTQTEEDEPGLQARSRAPHRQPGAPIRLRKRRRHAA